MGSWSVYCGISQIAITAGQECVLLPLKKNKNNETEGYCPATLPILGCYDDYGGIEFIIEDENTKLIEKFFNCTIQEFCHFFTRGCIRNDEKDFPKKLLENEELKTWKFLFIDKKVFDFMTSFVNDYSKGHHQMGNEDILKYLGFEYKGETSDRRYNRIWEYQGKLFTSDYTYLTLKDNNYGIYYVSSLENIVTIPKDKQWLKDKAWWQLWKLVDDRTKKEMLSKAVGLRRSYLYDNSFACEYLKNIDIFGDALSEIVTLLTNLTPMSGSLKPFELYITPQCGEREHHQVLLEKFAEINNQYLKELTDDE